MPAWPGRVKRGHFGRAQSCPAFSINEQGRLYQGVVGLSARRPFPRVAGVKPRMRVVFSSAALADAKPTMTQSSDALTLVIARVTAETREPEAAL